MRSNSDVKRPNILLLFPDQHRHDWLPGSADLPLRMPNLAKLMARGVQFTNAFTPSPICAPARACLASGRDYEDCGVPDNSVDYPLDQPTYYQRLRDAGYHVLGAGKFDLHKATTDWGLDGQRLLPDWGFTAGIDNEGKHDAIASGSDRPHGPYMAYLHRHGLVGSHVADFSKRRARDGNNYANTSPTPLPEDAYCDNWVADNAVRLLTDVPADEPWHLVVNFTGPHEPMDVTEDMVEPWSAVDFPMPVDNADLDENMNNDIRRRYAAMLENIDRHIGRLVDVITKRSELDRTIIAYSSDHGEMLGDHGRWAKSTYYQPSIGVPMVVAGPGVEAGQVSPALVALQDLAATFLDCASADPLPDVDGRSLWPVLSGTSDRHRPHLRSGLGSWRAVFDGRFKYVVDASGDELLFDHWVDPAERHDIAGQAASDTARLRKLSGVPAWFDEGGSNA